MHRCVLAKDVSEHQSHPSAPRVSGLAAASFKNFLEVIVEKVGVHLSIVLPEEVRAARGSNFRPFPLPKKIV